MEGERISGVFDRVTITYSSAGQPQAAHLIECKSDQLRDEPAAIARAVARHSQQTQLYCAALRQLTGLPPEKITASLLFTALPRLIPCDVNAAACAAV